MTGFHIKIKENKVFVVLRQGQAKTEELKKWDLGKLAKYKDPRWIEFIDQLPKSSTGKIQRFKLF